MNFYSAGKFLSSGLQPRPCGRWHNKGLLVTSVKEGVDGEYIMCQASLSLVDAERQREAVMGFNPRNRKTYKEYI